MTKALSLALHQRPALVEVELLGCDWIHAAQSVVTSLSYLASELRMMLLPPASDIDPSGEPDVSFL